MIEVDERLKFDELKSDVIIDMQFDEIIDMKFDDLKSDVINDVNCHELKIDMINDVKFNELKIDMINDVKVDELKIDDDYMSHSCPCSDGNCGSSRAHKRMRAKRNRSFHALCSADEEYMVEKSLKI